jgi:hypothetical protein
MNIIKKLTLTRATILTFVFIPSLSLIFRNYYPPALNYGRGEVTLNSILFLLFAVYAVIVSGFHFFQCHNSWETGKTWKAHFFFTYIYVFIIAMSLPFFVIFDYVDFTKLIIKIPGRTPPLFLIAAGIVLFFLVLSFLKFIYKSLNFYILISASLLIAAILLALTKICVEACFEESESIMLIPIFSGAFLFAIGWISLLLGLKGVYYIKSGPLLSLFVITLIPVLIILIYAKIFAPPFILSSGILLLILGIGGFRSLKGKPKSYIIINFLISILFLLGGAMPALLVLMWWIQGGWGSWA